jgi:hypothetical protein
MRLQILVADMLVHPDCLGPQLAASQSELPGLASRKLCMVSQVHCTSRSGRQKYRM